MQQDSMEQLVQASDAQLYKDVQNGIEVEKFLTKHPIGVYLLSRASDVSVQAAMDIGRLDYETLLKQLPQLHAEMSFRRQLVEWVDTLIHIGATAKEVLYERDAQEAR